MILLADGTVSVVFRDQDWAIVRDYISRDVAQHIPEVTQVPGKPFRQTTISVEAMREVIATGRALGLKVPIAVDTTTKKRDIPAAFRDAFGASAPEDSDDVYFFKISATAYFHHKDAVQLSKTVGGIMTSGTPEGETAPSFLASSFQIEGLSPERIEAIQPLATSDLDQIIQEMREDGQDVDEGDYRGWLGEYEIPCREGCPYPWLIQLNCVAKAIDVDEAEEILTETGVL